MNAIKIANFSPFLFLLVDSSLPSRKRPFKLWEDIIYSSGEGSVEVEIRGEMSQNNSLGSREKL